MTLNLNKPGNSDVLSINIGVPGNMKSVNIAATDNTVAAALSAAEVDATGYEIRVGGQKAALDTKLVSGQTVLLLRPVAGNFQDKPLPEPAKRSTINIGVPGKMRTVELEGDVAVTVADALKASEIDHSGYEIRVGGQKADLDTKLTSGQTVLLLRPVAGNSSSY